MLALKLNNDQTNPIISQNIQLFHQLGNDYILNRGENPDIQNILMTVLNVNLKESSFIWVLPSLPPDGNRSAGHCCCSRGT